MSSSLLSAAGAKPSSRSASGFVANAVRGFHVLRVDGFSVTTNGLPGGERITSDPFYVGSRCWYIDYYPNGADGAKDTSDAIALYLRLQGSHNHKKERVRADYKFSLLDLAGTAAYELPAETGIFTPAVNVYDVGYLPGGEGAGDLGCGYAAFITKEDLERRRDILLKEDSLVVRCDVAFAELAPMPVAPQQRNDARPSGHWPPRGRGRGAGRSGYHVRPGYDVGYDESADDYKPLTDAEYIRQCLGAHQL